MARVDNRRYSDADIEEVKRHNRVEEVIPEYGVVLRLEGRNFKGLCPFHLDREHPNLLVRPDKQTFRCWACKAWGDVIAFVQRKESVTFGDAVERLRARRPAAAPPRSPDRLGVGAPPLVPRSEQPVKRQWDRLAFDEQLVMNTARLVYERALWANPRALGYVRERGLPDWLIRHCGLGYSDGHSLEVCLRRGSGLRVAERLGLLRLGRQGTGCRELLAGRVVVPELRGGLCIWFIGRGLDDREDGPKYLALPGERPVLGLERSIGRREAFLCEGVFDYLTAVSWRLAACSFCGTSLPDDRLGFLAAARTIYGLFDGDTAGRAAGDRAGQQLGQRFRPVSLPEGSDLNDLGRRPDGRALFFERLAAVRAHIEAGNTDSDSQNAPEVTYAYRT